MIPPAQCGPALECPALYLCVQGPGPFRAFQRHLCRKKGLRTKHTAEIFFEGLKRRLYASFFGASLCVPTDGTAGELPSEADPLAGPARRLPHL